jgi:hypothetical protein
MPKALTIAGMAISIILLLMFGLDMAIGVPFGCPSMMMSATFFVFAGILAYLSWSTFRELK